MKRCPIAAKISVSIGILPCCVLTTSRRLTCIHAKLFPTVKQRTCIYVLRHYSRNSYCNFGRHASGSRLVDPGQKALQTMIEPTFFEVFCLIPLSDQPGTRIEKYFSFVKRAFVLVSLAVWSTRPCWKIGRCVSTSDGPDFVTKDRHCSKSSH